MNFVDDDTFQACENAGGVIAAERQGQTFGGGEPNVRRVGTLAAALGVGGITGAILDADVQGGAFYRRAQVAADVGGQRLQGRDIKGVQAGGWGWAKLGQGRQEARKGFAATGGGDEQGGGILAAGQHIQLVRVQVPAFGGEPGAVRVGGRVIIPLR